MFLMLFLSLQTQAAEWLPAHYAGQQQSQPVSTTPWWKQINDAKLTQHIEQALNSNAQIKLASHAEKAADYNASLLLASVLPRLSVGASSNTINCDAIGQFGPCITDFAAMFSPTPPEVPDSYNQGNYALRGGLQIDVSGSSIKLWKAAKTDANANREDTKQIKLDLAKQIAATHAAIGASKEQLGVINKQIDLNKTLLKAVELKYESGEANAVDVLQQEQNLARALAQAPMAEQNWKNSRQLLGMLLSQTDELPTGPSVIPNIPAMPTLGKPKDLLNNHASLKAIQHRVNAADLRVLPQYQNLFPIINLQGSYGRNWNTIEGRSEVESLGLEDHESIESWVMGVSVDIPLFDGGVAYNQSAAAKEALGITRSQLELALRSAVMTVETTFQSNKALASQLDSMVLLSEKSEQTWKNAMTNYEEGLIGFQQVQGALSGLLGARLTEINARFALFDARLQLFAALGGPWTQTNDWKSK